MSTSPAPSATQPSLSKVFGTMTGLMSAVKNNNCESMQQLLDNGAQVNEQNEKGSSALMVAAWSGNRDAVRILLDAPGINVNLADQDGNNAVMMVYMGCKKTEIMELFIRHPGFNIYAQNNEGNTVLHMSIMGARDV